MTTLLVALLCAAAPVQKPATTPPAESARSVVVLSDLGMGPAQSQARELNDAVNQEVRRSLSYAWKDPPQISIDELILALNCSNMDETCLKRAADNLKTDAVVFVASRAGTAGPEVLLTLVHVRPARPTKTQAVPLKDPVTTVNEVRQAARALLGPVKPTRLAVGSSPAGAEVLLDGKPAGVTPLVLTDIPEGPHALVLRMTGFQNRNVDVVLGAGESQELNVALVASAAPQAAASTTGTTETAAAGGGGSAMRTPLMAVGGVVVALGALGALAAAALIVSGLASWGAYWAVILINPGFKLGGTELRIPMEDRRAGGFATMVNAQRFGILTYATFFPGLALGFLALMVIAAGGVVAAVPFITGGE